jgi:DNA-binding transcriptional regulator YhcF (GntR family)
MKDMEKNNKKDGAIALYRSLLDWEWYKEANAFRVFIHCLIKANWKNKKVKGVDLKRGQFITSYRKISEELDLSIQNIRTVFSQLESTGEIKKMVTSKYTVVTVCKYDDYQINFSEANNQPTSNQHSHTVSESGSYGKENCSGNNQWSKVAENDPKKAFSNIQNLTQSKSENGYCESDSYKNNFFDLTTTNNIKNNSIKNNKFKNKSIVENEFRHPSQFSSNNFMKKDEEKSEGEVLIKSESISSKKDSIPPADFSEDVLKIYEAYPSTCFENRSRRLKSRKKNCKTIERILKKKEFEKEKLLKIISKYVDSCKPISGEFVPPLKGFDTFLNNIPDYTDKELGYVAEEKILDDDRFFFGAKFDEDMLEGFGGLDRIICMRFLHGEFKEFRFVQTTEIKNGTRGEYRFGWESLTADSFKFHEDRDFADDERMVLRADKAHRDEDKLKYLDI